MSANPADKMLSSDWLAIVSNIALIGWLTAYFLKGLQIPSFCSYQELALQYLLCKAIFYKLTLIKVCEGCKLMLVTS